MNLYFLFWILLAQDLDLWNLVHMPNLPFGGGEYNIIILDFSTDVYSLYVYLDVPTICIVLMFYHLSTDSSI